MATDNKSDDGRVGYKRPPDHSKFRPGQSGNPKGGHKPSRTLKADFIEELGETVAIRDGDREIKISKQRAVVKSLVAAAINGDMRAITALLAFGSRAFGHEPEDDQSSPAPDDLEIFARFVGREVRRHAARGEWNDNPQTPTSNKEEPDET